MAAIVSAHQVRWTPQQQQERFEDFRDWLIKQGKTKKTIKETVYFAKRFASVLDTGDASIILDTVNPISWHHVLSALANLSKYTRRYREFNEIRRNYNLRWVKQDPTLHLEKVLNPEVDIDSMILQVRKMSDILGGFMAKIIKFGVLVGLRSGEIIESVRLLNNREQFARYYGADTMTLYHYKFPELFLRKTKKAYISFVPPEIIENIGVGNNNITEYSPSCNAFSKACQRNGTRCDMRYCRKIHATYLYQKGIPVEIIDALQGRTPASMFTKHYYRPSLDYRDKVLDAITELQREIE